ncbi:MAG: carbohydrate-binding family 9-like protein [Gemmatimonadales bacterium]|jgi:hypothetical protein
MRQRLAAVLALALAVSAVGTTCRLAPRHAAHLPGQSAEFVPPEPIIPWAPRHYIAYRADKPITVDGRLDEAAWQAVPWTDDFVDIEGPSKPVPRFRTRAKMLWDSTNLYIGAELTDPDVWATITERDAVIFRDNDFEIFIDPNGDTESYYELEVNALGTAWDLFLPKAYRDEGHAMNGWDIHGLRVGVRVDGTLNHPGDVDRGWTVELALPWAALRDAANTASPPKPGDQWRMNFSRVEWKTRVDRGRYAKLTDPATGKPLPEDNWLWTPQGVVNVHYPEMWGFVQFSSRVAGQGTDLFAAHPEDALKWMLRVLYYRERAFHAAHGFWTDDLAKLRLAAPPLPGRPWPPLIAVTPSLYEASLAVPGGGRVILTSDGAVEAFR